jgi:rubrerythrin
MDSMIEYKDGKKYWNGRECDFNFVYRTLADMFPQDYERYIKESRGFYKIHTVLRCETCYYEWVHNETSISVTQCPSCKSLDLYRY